MLRTMKMPTIKDIPTPSALLSSAHNAYDHLSATITDMTAPLDHEEELWPQFEVSMQSVTDLFRMYAEFEIPALRHDAHETTPNEGSRSVWSHQQRSLLRSAFKNIQ